MRIDLYQEADLADVERVFKGLDLGVDPAKYPLPDFSNPLIRSKLVARTAAGEFVGLAYTRALVETALILDPKVGTNRKRMLALWALHEGTRRDLTEKGYDRAVALVTPKPVGYDAILERHGWKKETERQTFFYDF
jgi:hypothetical protein